MVGPMAVIQEYGWCARGMEVQPAESMEGAVMSIKAHTLARPAYLMYREHSMVTRPGGVPVKVASTWTAIQVFNKDGSVSKMKTITSADNRHARRARARAARRKPKARRRG